MKERLRKEGILQSPKMERKRDRRSERGRKDRHEAGKLVGERRGTAL